MDVREKTVTGMAKYIDREALVEWLKRIPLKDLSDGRGLCRVIFEEDFKRAIKKIPKGIIVDVTPVRHGSIIETIEDGRMKRVFSCCGTDFTKMTCWMAPKYCPNCGAKMDKGE